MPSHIASTQAVWDAIRAGEEDFLESFINLCARTRHNEASALEPLQAALSERLTDARPRNLSPWAYLGYYLIGSNALGTDQTTSTQIDLIKTEINRSQAPGQVVAYGDSLRAPQELWQLMLGHFQQGGDFVSDLEAPEPETENYFQEKIQAARRLIAEADSDLAELLTQLQSLIILCRPSARARARRESFGGATCFFFRGGSLINAARRYSSAVLLEQLVHEYAHAELFVLSQNEPLCLNIDDERHGVLIRPDPRPMNGIIHSLYVVGRVAELLQKLLKIEHADSRHAMSTTNEYKHLIAKQQELGISSLDAIRRHARLTPLGQEAVSASVNRLAQT